LKACGNDAALFKSPSESADRVRLICGFNIGELAGQSSSIGVVVLEPREFKRPELTLYFNELHAEDLVIFEDDHYSIIAPWTPAGKYAIDFYFRGKHEITDLDESDLHTFAMVGDAILRIYHKYLGITNVKSVMRFYRGLQNSYGCTLFPASIWLLCMRF